MAHLLEVRNVVLSFGGLRVLDGVGIDVGEWEIVGLIGPNGAGKTSLFNCVTGICQPRRGTVKFRGDDISHLPTHRRAARGIGRTWQHPGVVDSLTVFENVMLAQHLRTGYTPFCGIMCQPGTWRKERQLRRDTEEILDYLDLLPYAAERAGDLPYGVVKLCDLAMALATDPSLLLLDEPSSGMSSEEAEQLGKRLTALRETLDITIVMIEHHVPLVVGVCDYVYVLNFGRLLARGEPREIQQHPAVVAAYLGEAEAVDASA